MNQEILAILAASALPEAMKQNAIQIAISIAAPLAAAGVSNPTAALGDGTFLAFLMELLKMLLPIILQLLIPK